MTPIEKKILAAFEADPRAELPRATWASDAGAQNAISPMIERGWLRAGSAPQTIARNEDGRLQLAGPRDVTLYSRPGCHLCEEAKRQIAPLLAEFRATLREVNIDDDPGLRARYDHDVPVIFLGARKAAKHRVDLKQFRRQLKEAKEVKS